MKIKLTKTLTVNDDDKSIIVEMKKVGVWQKMKEARDNGINRTLQKDNYIFQWHAREGDTGFMSFHSRNPLELAELFLKICAITDDGVLRMSPVG